MGRHGVSRHGTTTSLCDQCRTESCLAAPAGDGGATALSLCRCEASRLSGAEAAGCPGSGRLRVCGDPAGPPNAGASRVSAGSGTRASMTGAATRTCRTWPRRAASRAPGRCERPLVRGGRRARAPASPGAPAPGARQGHRGSTHGRAAHSARRQRTGVCAHPPTRTVRGSCERDVA